eukprot:g10262.t1
MGLADVQPSAAIAAGSGGTGKFPQRKLSGDLKLRLARLPSLGGDGRGSGGDPGKFRRGSACGSQRERTEAPGTHRSSAASIFSSRKGYSSRDYGAKGNSGCQNDGGGGAGSVRRLSLTSARDGFSLVPTTGSVAVNGGVDSSRLNWRNPSSERGGGGIGCDSKRTSRSGGVSARSSGSRGVGESSVRGRRGPGSGGSEGGEEDDPHSEFMRELAAQNGLQLRCSQGEDERSRHQREVQRRLEVIDVHDFREAVKKLSLGLTEREILDFFRSFDADGSGGIDFNEFCEWVGATNESGDSDGDGEDGGGGRDTGGFRPSSGDSTKSISKRKMRDAQAKVKAASEKVPLRTMKENEQLLRQKILGSIGGGPFQLLRAFRKMHRGRGTVVDLNDFREAVTTFSLGLGEPEVVAFFKGFDADGSGGIDFEEFCAWVGGANASGEGAEQCLLPESKPTHPGGGAVDEEGMTPAQKAQEKVTRAFREQAGKMSSETLHKVLREKLISTVKPGGGTLLRTYHNLHRSGNVGGVELGDFKEAVHRYGMGVTDAQVEKLFRRYDKDGSGDIDFHEFLKLIMYAEDLAPEEDSSAAAADGPQADHDGRDGDGGGIRPLSPGWAARTGDSATDKQGDGVGGGEDHGTCSDPTKVAPKEGPAAEDGSAGDGAEGVVPGARCREGAPTKHQAGHQTSDSVLGSSPMTQGAMAEEKMKACVRSRWRHMLSAFRRHDPLRSGTVTLDEFQQVLKANKAMQSLGTSDVTALAKKHAAPRGRVDYPRFMRQLMIGSELATKGTGRGRRGGHGGGPGDDGEGRHGGSPRPRSAAKRRSSAPGLSGSKSTGALVAGSPSPQRSRRSDRQAHLHPIERPTSRNGGGGSSELRDRAKSICRELQPHIMRVWKPLWKDLKAADQSPTPAAWRDGSSSGFGSPGTRSRLGASRGHPYHGVSSGEVETHVFSSILSRHGLELSNRDLMTLEYLPAMAHKGWALPAEAGPGTLSSSSSSPPLVPVASAVVESEGHKGPGGNGRIPSRCYHVGCHKRPTYGVDLSRRRESCAEHARPGMVNIDLTRCARPNCETRATFGDPATGRRKFCSKHALPGMVNVERKTCARDSCQMPPAYWHPENRKRRCCIEHAEEGMVKLDKKLCPFKGCFTSASYGVPGEKRKFCAAHAEPGMVSIGGRRCASEECTKRANYGVEGTRNRQFCAEHAKAGMVNINNQKPPAPVIIRRKAGGTAEMASSRNKLDGGGGGGRSGSLSNSPGSTGSWFDASNVGFRGPGRSSHPNTNGTRWQPRTDVGTAYLGVGGGGGESFPRYAYRAADGLPADRSYPRYTPQATMAEHAGMRALSHAALGEDGRGGGWSGSSGGGGRVVPERDPAIRAEDVARQGGAGIGAASSPSSGPGEEMKLCDRRKGGDTATPMSSKLKREQLRPPGASVGAEKEEGPEAEGKGSRSSSPSSNNIVSPERPRVLLKPWPKSKEAPPLLLTSEGWSTWEWRPVEACERRVTPRLVGEDGRGGGCSGGGGRVVPERDPAIRAEDVARQGGAGIGAASSPSAGPGEEMKLCDKRKGGDTATPMSSTLKME